VRSCARAAPATRAPPHDPSAIIVAIWQASRSLALFNALRAPLATAAAART
jgi:hypothetical protein